MLTCYAANLGNANSKYFGDKIDKYDIVCTFCYNGDRWNYSIYSNKEYVDCSDIAKNKGGGGHPGASGFIMNTPMTKDGLPYIRDRKFYSPEEIINNFDDTTIIEYKGDNEKIELCTVLELKSILNDTIGYEDAMKIHNMKFRISQVFHKL